MKKEIIISLCITVIIIFGVIMMRKSSTPTLPSNQPGPSSTPFEQSGMTPSQVATHNTPSNCWIIINANVYNVTTYLTSHPGGSETITLYCGKDATDAYNAIKEGRGHSTSADTELTSIFIGTIQ